MSQRKANILYLGNMLSQHGLSASYIEVISPLFEQEGYVVVKGSSKRQSLIRLLHMVLLVFRHSRNTDIVLIDTYSTASFYYAVAVALTCRVTGKKYIPILHGGNLPNRLKKSPRLSRWLFNGAYCNVAPSNYLKSEFEKCGYKAHFISNVIEIEDYSFKERSEIPPKLLFVRSFHEIYNPQMAIKVVHKLVEDGVDVNLCMVGPDKDGSEGLCKDLGRELGVIDRITFTGRLSQKEWRDLSADYGLFINTTNYDNTPISIIEAMALGLPIVSTNPGGMPFLVEDGVDGKLVEKNDHLAMAKTIKVLLNEPDVVTILSRNGRFKAESFSWGVVKDRWNEILRVK